LNSIKALAALAVGTTTTFVSMNVGGAKDVSGNNVTAVGSENGLAATSFTQDTTPPELLSFTFSLDTGAMVLSFSETVNGSSFDPTELQLQSAANGTAAGVSALTLTGGTNATSEPSTTVSFVMLKEDLDAVKIIDGFATTESNTFVSASSGMVADMGTHPSPLQAVLIGSGLIASTVTTDSTAPEVVSFTFDLNAGVLNLSMSEPVVDSVNVTSLTLVSAADTAGHTLQSSSSAVLLDGQRLIQITLSALDLNAVKARPSLAVSTTSTVLSLLGSFAVDKNTRPVSSLSLSDSMTPSTFVQDATPPSLVSFALDLRTNKLRLTFSETINISSFFPTGVELRAALGNFSSSLSTYTLTGGAVSNSSTKCRLP